jgi:hypothetical protein
MRVVEILNKMERSKNIDGHYNHEILCHMPEIEKFIRELPTMTLQEFCIICGNLKDEQERTLNKSNKKVYNEY